jgi:hypothetical protein
MGRRHTPGVTRPSPAAVGKASPARSRRCSSAPPWLRRASSLSGHHRDYTAEELKERYGTHHNYVAQVRSAIEQAERDGYILPFDEKATIRAAKDSDVAR